MRLTVETGPLAGTQVALDRHHPATLGSGRECTVCIAEPGVATEHAVVKALRDEGFGVKALAPGLRLNGQEIEAAPLHDGDVLELGTTRVLYGANKVRRGPQLTGFRILGELGKGGMGFVYRAEQVSLHREVALKVLDKRFTDDAQFVAKFVAEARAAAKLSHPNVVHVFDVDNDSGTYYYAMELMHHGSLEAWLKKNGKMPVERALQVVADAATGLAYAESLGIVHRDIKPDNLMLDQHGTVKIADLGLAFTEEDPEEQLAGTPHFMAPEQVLRKGVDHRTDLYALGCTFYRLVTGRTPFRGQTVKDILKGHVREQAEPANKVEPSVPADVTAIIARLMQKEPADRYQSASELLDAVQELLQPPAKKGLWIGLAAAAVVVAGGAIWWAVTRPKEFVEVEKKYDDPEKQAFADQLRELRAQKKQDDAMIALLRVRLDAGEGLDLARALDMVAERHAGTTAAAEAQQLATRTRAAVAERESARQRALQFAEQALVEVRGPAEAAIAAGDLPRALTLLGTVRTPDGADKEAISNGIAALRQRIRERASARIAELHKNIDQARTASDGTALQDNATALSAIVRADGWPDELVGDRAALQEFATTAAAAAHELGAAQRAAEWQSYAEFVHGSGGIDGALARADFGAAAKTMESFAAGGAPQAVTDRARTLAASLQRAAVFGDALQAAAERGELQLALDQDTTQPVTHWQRDGGTLTVTDASKKPPRETSVAIGNLSIEQWTGLARQVTEPDGAVGGRDAFVGFVAVQRHIVAARAYLGGLVRSDDDSGTSNGGYPLGFVALDALLQRLPESEPWTAGLRSELQATRLLAQGLRALSERRNLAAANYLDRLVADHPHELCVTALP